MSNVRYVTSTGNSEPVSGWVILGFLGFIFFVTIGAMTNTPTHCEKAWESSNKVMSQTSFIEQCENSNKHIEKLQ